MKIVSETASFWLRRNRNTLLAVLSSLAFVAVAMALTRITRNVRYDDVVAALSATRWPDLLLAIAFTAISFVFLVRYDLNALDHIGHRLPLGPVAAVSFSAYAVGNTAGFGALSGGAIRFRGYGRLGLSGEETAHVVAFITIAFGVGLSALSGISLLFFADQVAGFTGYHAKTLRIGAVAVLLAVLAGVLLAWRTREHLESVEAGGAIAAKLPSLREIAMQFLVTAGDVAAAASVLYVLLPPDIGIGWPAFATLYCIAIGLGVLSHVPAGLGVFEAVILGGLGPTAPTDAVIGSLVLYRLIYHVLPLLLAVLALAATELLEYRDTVAEIWTRPLSAAVIPPLLAMLALLCGVMLVFSSVLPTPQSNLDWLAANTFVPIQLLEAAHFLSSILGLLLIVVARGLVNRLDGAFWAGLIIAALAMVLAIPKAFAAWEAAVLGVLILGLVLNRRSFSRPASLLAEPLTTVWIGAIAVILIAAVTILLFVYRDVDYSRALWWQFEFSDEAPRGLRAMLGVTLVAALIAFASLLRPARARPETATAEEIARAIEIARTQDDSAANLVRMGDKSILFSEDGRAFLMYGVQGRSWISLFGPIGAPDAKPELIWRFVEAARAAGGRAAFYQVTPDLLPAFADVGLRALKLGEMARIDLSAMDLQTSRWGEPRRALNKGLREGMRLEVLDPEAVPAVLDALQAISDTWLARHEVREKGFALGRFERDFVASQPVAVLRANERIVAFATLMVTDTREEATVDLMRFADDAPKGAMDFLFVSLFVAMKEAGYRHFNLGMAPLSGFATHASAPVWNHVGQAIFTHGERFYNFKGLRAFKAKYNPDWEPRYLVVGGQMSPVSALVDVTLLIGGGLKGVVGK